MKKRLAVVALMGAALVGCGSTPGPTPYVVQVAKLATALQNDNLAGALAVCIANIDLAWGRTSADSLTAAAQAGNTGPAVKEYQQLSELEGIEC